MDQHDILLRRRDHKRANYERALQQFEDFCDGPISRPIEVAGLIQGFKFTFELAWKLLHVLCRLKGIDVGGPRDTLKAAYGLDLISQEQSWLAMLEDRNSTTHRYDEEFINRLKNQLLTVYRQRFCDLRDVARL
jgi:nucleotidyltransferase substrate binding protein (TIGR01987 family)